MENPLLRVLNYLRLKDNVPAISLTASDYRMLANSRSLEHLAFPQSLQTVLALAYLTAICASFPFPLNCRAIEMNNKLFSKTAHAICCLLTADYNP